MEIYNNHKSTKMKKAFTLLALILLIISCDTVNKNEFAIVIHGGAGTILKKKI